jgi:hypothetical protein
MSESKEIWIDKHTHRTLELRMTAAGHFMHHRYGPFNAPLTISPPHRPRGQHATPRRAPRSVLRTAVVHFQPGTDGGGPR